MRCPSLKELPPPPPGKTGWPWTEESVRLSERTPAGECLPRVTVVTPSFNQGRFIEETIRSILLQGYSDLEYFVLDGGSSDNTVEIIKRYSLWIDFWVSEADGGQSSAINRGLRMGSGSHAIWINSDDMLCKNALSNHVLGRKLSNDVVYIGDCIHIDVAGKCLFTHRGGVKSLEDFLRVRSVWRAAGGSIDQPAVLFPLELLHRVGGLNERNHFTMDYELWGQFLLAGADFEYTEIPFGIFRWHDAQKTQEQIKQTESMLDVAAAFIPLASSLSEETRREIQADLEAYRTEYPLNVWKQSGRLARMGFPRRVVTPVRSLRNAVEKTIGSFIKFDAGAK
jgi:glycosyl transferase family 2